MNEVNVGSRIFVFAFGYVRRKRCANSRKAFGSDACVIEIPYSKLDAHERLPPFAYCSAAGKHRIDLRHVRLVVDDFAVDLYPGMSDEWQLLNADDQFGGEAEFLEETRRRCGTLQTADILEVESGGKLDGMADLLLRRSPALGASNPGVVNRFVNR
jgi:hypothetical protein